MQKRQARMEADQEPERLMREGMEATRNMLETCKVDSNSPVLFERLRGIVLNEEDET